MKGLVMILGYLLHKANGVAGECFDKATFYSIKNKVLELFGSEKGKRVQSVSYTCHSCYGTGYYSKKDNIPCYNCEDGIYVVRYSKLILWRLGNHTFHTWHGLISSSDIAERIDKFRPDLEKLTPINGLIVRDKANINQAVSFECTLWLFLLFDWKVFIDQLTTVRPPIKALLPLSLLHQTVYFILNFDLKLGECLQSMSCYLLDHHRDRSLSDCDDLPF